MLNFKNFMRETPVIKPNNISKTCTFLYNFLISERWYNIKCCQTTQCLILKDPFFIICICILNFRFKISNFQKHTLYFCMFCFCLYISKFRDTKVSMGQNNRYLTSLFLLLQNKLYRYYYAYLNCLKI